MIYQRFIFNPATGQGRGKLFSFLIAALPALLMWELVSVKVNIRLPKPLRKRLFKTGARFALIALIVEITEKLVPLSGYRPLKHAFLESLFCAAIPEEAVKYLAVYRVGKRELNEIGPGIAILLAVGISLGFAVLENRLYVLGGGLAVWTIRALTAIPMHMVFGLVMGSFMAIAWRDYRKIDYNALLLAFIIPVFFHFAYDFVAMSHAYAPALRWPKFALPIVMVSEGIFAMILTNHAVNGATAIYGARIASDPTGKRAGILAFIMFSLVFIFAALAIKFPEATNLPVLAAMPLVLAVDLSLIALYRLSPSH